MLLCTSENCTTFSSAVHSSNYSAVLLCTSENCTTFCSAVQCHPVHFGELHNLLQSIAVSVQCWQCTSVNCTTVPSSSAVPCCHSAIEVLAVPFAASQIGQPGAEHSSPLSAQHICREHTAQRPCSAQPGALQCLLYTLQSSLLYTLHSASCTVHSSAALPLCSPEHTVL